MIDSIDTLQSVSPEIRSSGRNIRPALLFTPPLNDAHFAALPDEVRTEVRELLAAFRQIQESGNVLGTCKRLAGLATLQGKRRGWSAVRLKKKYEAFVRSGGDWKVLINRAKAPVDRKTMPAEFLEFWRGLCQRNQRCNSQAHRELLVIWRTRFDPVTRQEVKSIPGYSTWPKENPIYGHPDGWSDGNLDRYTPDKYDLVLSRIGRAAASQYRLPVLTTRVGLRVGQYYQFDDHEFNKKVNFLGVKKAMRPRGFTAVDVFSSCFFATSFKPTLWDEDQEKKKVLSERDFAWFVIMVLTRYGFRTDEIGTILCCEHGTAAIGSVLEQRIFDATRGHVRLETSGMFGGAAHAGQFEAAGKGNFKFKGLIESFFNLIDNYLASYRGQVGKDRNHCPEQLHGMDRYNDMLIRFGLEKPELVGRLNHPFHSFGEFTEILLSAFRAINTTDKHELEGWERMGFIATEWRLTADGPFLPESALLDLPPEERRIALALIDRNPALKRTRKLGRQEVYDRGSGDLTRLEYFMLPTLLGPENCVKNPQSKDDTFAVRSQLLTVEDSDIDPDPMHFIARNSEGRLPEGERYKCFLNPFDPSHLVACDARLRPVAVCQRYVAPCRADAEGVKRVMGQAKAAEAEAIQRAGLRQIGEAKAIVAMREHNAAVINPQTPAERKFEADLDRQARKIDGDISELESTPAPVRTEESGVSMEELNQLG